MSAHGPQILRSSARAVGDRVRVTFTFPIAGSEELTWDFGCVVTIEQIDAHIEELKSARDVARVIQAKLGEKSAPNNTTG